MQNLLGYGGESYVKNGVAAVCLLDPSTHAGSTYRLGYEAKRYYELAEAFTKALGLPFSYEPQPPADFLRNVLAAGAEPAYMKCVFDSYTDLTNGKDIPADEIFDNFHAITGRQPKTIAQFAMKHAASFKY
jgi:uncharacterized protein YbjT (DUF2867 family)